MNLGRSYNVALGYQLQDHTVGVGFFNNKRKYNGDSVNSDVYSATYKYKVAPGLSLFSEFNHVAMKTGRNAYGFEKIKAEELNSGIAVDNNKANVFMIGTALNF